MYNSSKRQQQNRKRSPFDHLGNLIGWIVFFGLTVLVILLILETIGIRF